MTVRTLKHLKLIYAFSATRCAGLRTQYHAAKKCNIYCTVRLFVCLIVMCHCVAMI